MSFTSLFQWLSGLWTSGNQTEVPLKLEPKFTKPLCIKLLSSEKDSFTGNMVFCAHKGNDQIREVMYLYFNFDASTVFVDYSFCIYHVTFKSDDVENSFYVPGVRFGEPKSNSFDCDLSAIIEDRPFDEFPLLNLDGQSHAHVDLVEVVKTFNHRLEMLIIDPIEIGHDDCADLSLVRYSEMLFVFQYGFTKNKSTRMCSKETITIRDPASFIRYLSKKYSPTHLVMDYIPFKNGRLVEHYHNEGGDDCPHPLGP
jgi:hypothetical protein